MLITEIQSNKGGILLEGTVTEKGEVRSFTKFGKTGKVCTLKVADSSGTIKLTLWNDDSDKVALGDQIQLENGWCSEYQGEKQVSPGKFGTLTVIDRQEQKEDQPAALPAAPQTTVQVPEEEEEDEDDDHPIKDEEAVE